MNKNRLTDKNYVALLKELRSILQRGLGKAYKAVDNVKVQTYWQLGERIVREELGQKDRADYGKKLIDNLAVDMDFRRDDIYRFVQFYKTYPIVVTLSRQLSWSHYIELIKVKVEEERKFYEMQSEIESWDVRKLRKKIKSQKYNKAKKIGKIVIKLPLQLRCCYWQYWLLEQDVQLRNQLLRKKRQLLKGLLQRKKR